MGSRFTLHVSPLPFGIRTVLLPLLAAGVLAACGGPRVRPVPQAPAGAEVGYASWYGHPYHGRRTSSGEVYDMYQLTAAHRTLPLGTWVLVTNLGNGRSLEVRINDRGPFKDERIIDLSYAAARALDLVGPGTALVSVLPLLPAARAGSARPAQAVYTLQVGAFRSEANAQALASEIGRSARDVHVSRRQVGGETYYRVRVGRFASRPSAMETADRLAGMGYRVIVVEEGLEP